MATTNAPPPRPPPPSSRRTSSPLSNGASNSIAKGATARSAVPGSRTSSSLGTSVIRRPSVRSPTRKTPTPPPALNVETRETLATSLREETEQKELLLVQVQTKDQTISTLTAENNNIQFALNAAETRLAEFYADQARIEEEMAARIEVTEKLRAQVRELEKERRDIQRRYNEQTTTFEAERQAAYDNEQHLKSRIQSLMQARKQPEIFLEPASAPGDVVSEIEPDEEDHSQKEVLNSPPSVTQPQDPPESKRQNFNDPEQEPAEMTSLKLELSTLSTSYSSLQNTLLLLQTQLVDIKRVNHELQEENESYMILLREKTLSGKFDVRKQVGGSPSTDDEDDDDDEDPDMDTSGDVKSTNSTTKSALDPVEEEIGGDSFEQDLEHSLEPHDIDSHSQSSRNTRHLGRHARKRGSSISQSPNGAPRGESLAGLPLTGPGLDLAAELGRAENKDMLEGDRADDRENAVLIGKGKRGKKHSSDARKVSEDLDSTRDVDALRTEVKSLKDANKALSLYASKIIDRIISMEGFEHVLAVDFDKLPTPTTTSPNPAIPSVGGNESQLRKPRPQSTIFGGRSTSNPTPATTTEKLTTFSTPITSPNLDTAVHKKSKSQRRSLSFDWKSFSMFGGSDKKLENPSLRPLTLKPGAAPVTGIPNARKLDTEEDEEDRRERDRLQATMKLMGIEPNVHPPVPATATPVAVPMDKTSSTSTSSPQATRWALLGGGAPAASSETSSIHSTPSIHGGSPRPSFGGDERPSNLTQEALRHVEAENSLAALDAHEQALSAEIARGAGGGFTEIPRRGGAGRRSRRSGVSGSGSTVWSAGNADGSEE